MPLETGTYISDLNPSNPLGSDPLAFSDDHLRLIKSTLKNTFPNVTGAVTKTHAQINDLLEKSGGTMTGPITLSGNATSDLHAVPRQQVVSLMQALYPVGTIYINATNNTNPATLLGFGTWVAFGAGRVPVGFDAGDSLFNAAEKTGGSKDAVVVSHTHTGTTSTNGAHSHDYQIPTHIPDGERDDNWQFGESYATAQTSTNGAHNHTFTTDSTGSSGTNANLQPYITVYMWKRTA